MREWRGTDEAARSRRFNEEQEWWDLNRHHWENEELAWNEEKEWLAHDIVRRSSCAEAQLLWRNIHGDGCRRGTADPHCRPAPLRAF